MKSKQGKLFRGIFLKSVLLAKNNQKSSSKPLLFMVEK